MRIVVAEDVELNQDLIATVLGKAGHEVVMVGDGAKAVAAVQAAPCDLVLMDLRMPVMDGLAATRAIRDLGSAYATLPIIALSANAEDQTTAELTAQGLTGSLAKPFAPAALLEVVRRAGAQVQTPDNPVLTALIEQIGEPATLRLLAMLQVMLEDFDQLPATEPDKLRHAAHAARGSAGALGFRSLMLACRALEDDCRMQRDPVQSLADAQAEAADARRAIRQRLDAAA